MQAKARPKYYELEQFRRSVNRKIWTVVCGSLLISLLCVGLAALHVLKPIPVVAFDQEGRAMMFADTMSPRLTLERVRVEYFSERFLELFVGIDSASIERDFADALNMMTPRLREIMMNDEGELARRAELADANVHSRFDGLTVKMADYDPEDTGAKVYAVATGKMVFEPRVGVLPEEEGRGVITKHLFSELVFHRVPISKVAIHGMLVDYVHTKVFDNEEQLRVFALKRRSQ